MCIHLWSMKNTWIAHTHTIKRTEKNPVDRWSVLRSIVGLIFVDMVAAYCSADAKIVRASRRYEAYRKNTPMHFGKRLFCTHHRGCGHFHHSSDILLMDVNVHPFFWLLPVIGNANTSIIYIANIMMMDSQYIDQYRTADITINSNPYWVVLVVCARKPQSESDMPIKKKP